MEFPGFSVLPRPSASPRLQERVGECLTRLKLLDRLPKTRKVWVYVEVAVEEGASLAEAHKVWSERGLPAAGLDGLPRQAGEAACPAGLVRVTVECFDRPAGSGSFHGFKGYFASLLLDPEKGEIWDSRGEPAS